MCLVAYRENTCRIGVILGSLVLEFPEYLYLYIKIQVQELMRVILKISIKSKQFLIDLLCQNKQER